MIKKIFFILLLVACCLFSAPQAQAKDFSSFYKTTYKFSGEGVAYITQEISFLNQTAEKDISEFSLSIMGAKIDNVEAFDSIGPLETTIDKNNETTKISVRFNKRVVGKDKTLSFIIKYLSKDFIKKEGNLWQISLPKLAGTAEIDDYQLFVQIPQSMGNIASINPFPKSQTIEDNFIIVKYEKNDLVNFGVQITIGQYQTFDFKIDYVLQNNGNEEVIKQIAFPPDTDFQTIFYRSILPKPENVEKDSDGNWLASYIVPPQQTISIQAIGQANIFIQSKKTSSIKEDFQEYLAPTQYWQSDDPKIKSLAQKLKTPEKIYRYVVENLTYDYDLIKKGVRRKGALATLESPQSCLCGDFTDLFIALCRAAGIPAKALDGYAYTNDLKIIQASSLTDILHSWPEYYDGSRKLWVQVDPTWENTSHGLNYFNKFDMSHFVFVIHGKNDSFPTSPGSYSEPDFSGKQVFVNFGKEDNSLKKVSFSLSEPWPSTIFSYRKTKIETDIINDSGFVVHQQVIGLKDDNKVDPSSFILNELLPYSKTKISFMVRPSEFFKDYVWKIPLIIGSQNEIFSFNVTSVALRLTILIVLFLLIILFVILRLIARHRALEKKEKVVS